MKFSMLFILLQSSMEAALHQLIADFWAEPLESTRWEVKDIPELGLCTFGYTNSRKEEEVKLVIHRTNKCFIWKTQKHASNDFWNPLWCAMALILTKL